MNKNLLCKVFTIIYILLLGNRLALSGDNINITKCYNKKSGRFVEAASGEILVKFKNSTSASEILSFNNSKGCVLKKKIRNLNILNLKIPPGKDLEKIIEEYENNPDVEFAEPNCVRHALAISPNDTHYYLQWGMHSALDVDIDAPEAWALQRGTSAVIVAVLDTGVDLDHEDLQAKIVSGYDFVNDDSVPDDDAGHGTHVAGIVAAITNNALGVAGVSWYSRIMPLKVLDDEGTGLDSDVADAIQWAANNGAKVINLSLGSTSDTLSLSNAVNYAYASGCVIVASMGNLNDTTTHYPAGYSNVIAVGAINEYNIRCSTSDWGNPYGSCYGSNLDVCAPGNEILSTYYLPFPNQYGYLNGTSMATPFVSGIAALLCSWKSSITPDEIEAVIENTADDITGDDPSGGTCSAGWDQYTGYGRVNAYKAVLSIMISSYVPVNLTCDGKSNPQNLRTVVPDFSWGYPPAFSNVSQQSYRLLVSSSQAMLALNDGTSWDSGVVASSDTTDIQYAGSGLSLNTTYYWKAMGWLSQSSGPFCTEQYFMVSNTAPVVVNPLCNGRTNPCDLRTDNIKFYWTFSDTDSGDYQAAYRVLVSTSQQNLFECVGEEWDSGKVYSSTGGVACQAAVNLNTAYYWKVFLWDVFNASSTVPAQSFMAANSSPLKPQNLLCNGESSPAGIDKSLFVFTWVFSDEADDSQSAFRIILSTDAGRVSGGLGDFWDTGKIISTSPAVAVYLPVKSSGSYFWSVRTWDKFDFEGPFGDTRSFSTAVLYWEYVAVHKTGSYGSMDVGDNSAPAFGDLDDDGDAEMFVGELGNDKLNYFRNDGDIFEPGWAFMTDEYIVSPKEDSKPFFVDIDGDGDLDLYIGRGVGSVKFLSNIGTKSTPAWNPEYPLPDMGDAAAPCFADIDGDADYDLFIGEKDGNINYYRNTGSTASFSWSLISANYAGIDIGDNSTPAMADIDNDGDYDLFVGAKTGKIYYYRNDGNANVPAWVFVTGDFYGINAGSYSAPAFLDYDSDGDLDLFTGKGDGGMMCNKNLAVEGNLPPAVPAEPRVEGEINPVHVISTAPVFSWAFSDPNPGYAQGSFRILVSSSQASLNANIGGSWEHYETGKSSFAVYSGGNLSCGKTYYWKAMAWDVWGASSAYCSNQSFVMEDVPGMPVSPLCEGQDNPDNVLTLVPEFSWAFSDPVPGESQGAYRLLVATSSALLGTDYGNMWDTGKASTSASSGIVYGGLTLNWSTTYYWKVRTWDNYGMTGPFSSIQYFYVGNDNIKPQAVTSLSAVTGAGNGEIGLSWTAPYDWNQTGLVASYVIKYATFSVESLGSNTTLWWNASAQFSSPPPPHYPGYKENTVVTGLSPFTRYWFSIKSADSYNNFSDIDVSTPRASALARLLFPGVPDGFQGVTQSTGSIKWLWNDKSGNEYGFRVISSTGGNISGDLIAGATSWIETGLNPNSQYLRAVQVFNATGTANSSSYQRYTFANPPSSLVAGETGKHSISISWAPGTGGNTRYAVEKSTDGVFFTMAKSWADSLSAAQYGEDNLKQNTTYWYRVYGYNGNGVLTAEHSNELDVKTDEADLILSNASDIESVLYLDGSIKVLFSTGAVQQNGYLIISTGSVSASLAEKIATANSRVEGFEILDASIVQFSLYDEYGGVIQDNFQSRVDIEIPFLEEDLLKAGGQVIDLETLRIFLLDEDNCYWEMVDGSHKIQETNTVMATINHLSSSLQHIFPRQGTAASRSGIFRQGKKHPDEEFFQALLSLRQAHPSRKGRP